jgi:hypothetical protein
MWDYIAVYIACDQQVAWQLDYLVGDGLVGQKTLEDHPDHHDETH